MTKNGERRPVRFEEELFWGAVGYFSGGDGVIVRKGEKTVDLGRVRIWRQGDRIHLRADDADFIITINDNPSSGRGHPHLYGHRKRVLAKLGCWEASGEER